MTPTPATAETSLSRSLTTLNTFARAATVALALFAPIATAARPVFADEDFSALAADEVPAEEMPVAQPVDAGFAYGMQAHLYGQDVPGTLGLVQNAGFGWVKQQVRWSEVEPAPGQIDFSALDAVVANAAAQNVRVLFSVVTAPAWSRTDGTTDGPPDDPALFGSFLSQVAARYAGQVQAYEIWNEQNLSREWGGGRINAGAYVELLKAAYPAIKTADPSALVLSGALTPTGFNDPNVAIDDVTYLQQMYAYEDGVVKTVIDAIGAHAGGFNNAPDDLPGQASVASTTFKGHPSFYFRRIEQLREIMVLSGDSEKKLWITEAGWSTANQAPGYEYGQDNSEDAQAQYLVRAYQLAHDYGWVGGMFVWNLNFEQEVPATDEKFPFGIVNPDGSPRPAYTALAQMPKLP